MAKYILNGEILDYIVSVRNDTSKQIYTYQNIADMVSAKFGVNVTCGAVRLAYLRHSKVINNTPAINQNKSSNFNKPKTGFDFSKQKEKTSKPVEKSRTFVEVTDEDYKRAMGESI